MTDFIQHISKSLGRSSVPDSIPKPPAVDPRISRLVSPTADIKRVFIERAEAAKLLVEPCSLTELPTRLVTHLRRTNSDSVVVTRCSEFEQVGLSSVLDAAGIRSRYWDDITLDASYDVAAGVTDVWMAIAETGSLVVRASTSHGRAVSLVPPLHVAMVRTSQIVPDLMDAMSRIDRDSTGSGVVIITGPSKTADIEMNLVVGVHGPGEVVVLLIDDSASAA
jgi:L-lactate dehydrogenase complex protein LldG